MKHDEIIQSVPQWWAGGAMLRLCRTAVALIAIITRLRPTDFIGRAIILSACLSACSLPAIFLAGLPAIFLAGLPAISLAGCRKEAPPQPYVRSIDLEALDASCTEAWLRVRFTDSAAPRAFALKRDGQTILSALNSPPDTLVIDEGLLPNRTYTYKAYRLEVRASGFEVVDSSTQATVTTMDTTSHNFTWQIDTLGDGASSILYDVAIINDTLAYAVGEIYKRDSLGNWDPNAYNLVKWNGNTWELKRIPFIGPCSAVDYPPLTAIWAFSANHILVTNGGAIVRYDGTHAVLDCGMNSLLAGAINKLYATNPQDVYLVGNAGTIAHYDGVRWRRIESGTQLSVYDVFGSTNPITGETEVLAIASNVFQNQGAKLLRIQGNAVAEMPGAGLTWGVRALWFSQGKRYYVVGPGIHQKRSLSDSVWSIYPPGQVTSYASSDVRGTNVNDVFVVGSFREAVHFNGVSWKRYNELLPGTSGVYAGVAVKGDFAVIVGFDDSWRAIAIIGRR